jgi:hypothetical protein
VPPLVRTGDPGSRAPSCRPRRGHRPSHGRVDSAATARSLFVGRSPAISRPRSRFCVPLWTTTAAGIGIEELLTAPRSPWQNAYAER